MTHKTQAQNCFILDMTCFKIDLDVSCDLLNN